MRHGLQQKFLILGFRKASRNIKSCCCVTNTVPLSKFQLLLSYQEKEWRKIYFLFTYVGVDYFGPIELKAKRQTLERWVRVFTCMSARPKHFEKAYLVDNDCCLGAVVRFIARTGHPSTIWSDNGTIFVGANNDLKQFASMWQTSDFQDEFP